MLAAPRQRKWCLTPKGKALYEDENRLGTKLLQKMGWSKGKGLGKNEDGSENFIRVRYKNNAEGLGFEARDDQWSQHETTFNGLLNDLNKNQDKEKEGCDVQEDGNDTGMHGSSNRPKPNREKLVSKLSGESLEEKSKRSRARVHYKKFTKCKDLKQYSEKDLANIFGKKVVEEKTEIGIYEKFTELKFSCGDDTSNKAESTTIHANMSIDEYFKQKMEVAKNKLRDTSQNDKLVEMECMTETTVDIAEPLAESIKFDDETNSTVYEVADKKPKKKKKRKNLDDDVCNISRGSLQNHKFLNNPHLNELNNKKKKSKKKSDESKVIIQSQETNSNGSHIPNPSNELLKEISNSSTVVVQNDNESILESIKATNSEKMSETISEPNDIDQKKNYKDPYRLEELTANHEQNNTYKISAFCAEKFGYADFERFVNSNLKHIVGYGLSETLQLDIKPLPSDESRINQLWNCTLNKYRNAATKNPYSKYISEAYTARKSKKKIPRLRVKSFKRKHVFGRI